MRDHLARRYFDTAHSIVQATVDDDLPPLLAAAQLPVPTSQRVEDALA
jgi:uncharacterized protein with HEPN domain